jgi:NADH:ubiquinone oxidoreductase subunit F (NADH-binding)
MTTDCSTVPGETRAPGLIREPPVTGAPGQAQRPAARQLPRLLPAGAGPADLRAHLRALGPLAYRGGPGILTGAIEAAGLTGRGGAAFPVHRKLSAVTRAGRRPVVVANGAEGEPLSRKDQTLLWQSPHLVLDGLQLASEAVGARSAGLYVHRNAALRQQLATALAQRAAAGVDRTAVELVEAPGRFLSGEESALVSVLNGDGARPGFKQPPVYQKGIGGQPTLVQNVETLAHIALIARFGPQWFRALGTPDEPGSMLCTVLQADGSSTVLEAVLGTPLTELLALDGNVQAVLSGGYHGAWLEPAAARRLSLRNADLKPAGGFVGAGVLAALPADRCGVTETARVTRYLAVESAGQCGPCVNGLPRMATALAELAAPAPDPAILADLRRWAGLVVGRGACHHPDGTVRFVRSALTVFAAEIDRHIQGFCTATTSAPFLPLPRAASIGPAGWR